MYVLFCSAGRRLQLRRVTKLEKRVENSRRESSMAELKKFTKVEGKVHISMYQEAVRIL